MSQRTSCALDHRGCLPLRKILGSFGAPASEEQAWALCYACIQCYQDISVEDRDKCVLVTDLNHVILNKDGYVQSTTFLPENTEGRCRIGGSTEAKVVAELGVVLYRSLDFSLTNDEERDLSPSLHHLIDLMTSAECERGETDDEGIEQDSGDSEDELDRYTNFGMHDALELCQSRITKGGGSIGSGDQSVSDHYRAVVRAIVAEAVDLSFFLQNVATSKLFLTNSPDLLSTEGEIQKLQCEDWARLWMQVMRQLRDGVKLKKGSYTLQPLEYSLTPYEMLMEDIRSRRYNLNPVMENGDIPVKLKKDAHSIILDFIRSRPPLKKASERKLLPPPRKVSSPMELLMESIRKDQKNLKHVQTPVRSRPLSRHNNVNIPGWMIYTSMILNIAQLLIIIITFVVYTVYHQQSNSLVGKAVVGSDGVSHAPALTPDGWKPLKLEKRTDVSDKMAAFVFALPKPTDHLGCLPGQYLIVRVNINGKEQTRYFSPVSHPNDYGRVELVLRFETQGAMSKHFKALKPGDEVEFQGPCGGFEYDANKIDELTLLASGGGITPGMQLIRCIMNDTKDKTRIKLIYFSENCDEILYKEELDKYAGSDSRLNIVYSLGECPEGWEGEEGFIDTDMIDRHVTKPNGHKFKVVMCGGPTMSIGCLHSLRSLGYASDCVFIYGQFGTEQVKTVFGRNVKLSNHRCDNAL